MLRQFGLWLVAIFAGLLVAALLGGTIPAIVIGLAVAYAVRYLPTGSSGASERSLSR